jgi:hypothetical protein
MNIQCHQRARERASVLIVTLFMGTLFGMFLFSYLYIERSQKLMASRSQAWNASLALAEAGIEEGLAQLNPGAPLPIINRAGNGWGGPTNGLYGPVSRYFSNSAYTVVITTNTMPIIYSTGRVMVPSLGATIFRTLRVMTTNIPMFTVGIAAINNINFNGNNVATDSFNSGNTNLSTNGHYDSTKTSTNGTIASIAGVVNVGNANINGSVLLGPNASNTIKNNGVVTGGVSNDFNVNFPDVILPSGSAVAATSTSQTIGGVSYQYVFSTSGYYSINNLGGNVYVSPGAQVTLLLTGSASPNTIEVGADTNGISGQLTIYMNGPSFSLTGRALVDGGVPANLSYLGSTNNTSITMSGNASFIGTIYAPEASMTLGGGGSGIYDFVGACIIKTITMSGHYQFHFDEALLNASSRGYVATGWQEL